jgi:hypothetical protein
MKILRNESSPNAVSGNKEFEELLDEVVKRLWGSTEMLPFVPVLLGHSSGGIDP